MGSPSDYEVIFNLAAGSYQPPLFVILWTTVFGILCLVGVATRRGAQRLLAGAAALAVLAFGLFTIFQHHQESVRMRADLVSGRASAVEGIVRDFRADSPIGNGVQTFSIAGQHFNVSSNRTTPAFRRTVGKGGPDLTGKCVRAVFVRDGVSDAQIVWLGIRRDGCDET